MRYLILIFYLLAVPVAAQEYDDDTNQFKVVDPVPYPLPAGYNRCIKATINPDWRDYYDAKIKFFTPPLTEGVAHALNVVLSEKRGKLEHCNSSDS